MPLYKLAKGWTKAKVLRQVMKFNNGTRAIEIKPGREQCLYKTPDGNRCAIGAFIPFKGGKTLAFIGGVDTLLGHYPALKKYMPFDDIIALAHFQNAHNKAEGNVIDSIKTFLDKYVA